MKVRSVLSLLRLGIHLNLPLSSSCSVRFNQRTDYCSYAFLTGFLRCIIRTPFVFALDLSYASFRGVSFTSPSACNLMLEVDNCSSTVAHSLASQHTCLMAVFSRIRRHCQFSLRCFTKCVGLVEVSASSSQRPNFNISPHQLPHAFKHLPLLLCDFRSRLFPNAVRRFDKMFTLRVKRLWRICGKQFEHCIVHEAMFFCGASDISSMFLALVDVGTIPQEAQSQRSSI